MLGDIVVNQGRRRVPVPLFREHSDLPVSRVGRRDDLSGPAPAEPTSVPTPMADNRVLA